MQDDVGLIERQVARVEIHVPPKRIRTQMLEIVVDMDEAAVLLFRRSFVGFRMSVTGHARHHHNQ